MGTVNFHWEKILVAVESSDEDEVEDYDMLMDCIGTHLEDKLGGVATNEWDSDSLRSYPGRIAWTKTIETKDGLQYKVIQVVVRGGYYSGCNIDYKIIDGGDLWLIEDQKRGTKGLDKEVERVEKRLHSILPTFGTELRQVAVFSNGEAIYESK
jgi:hypothetical protein